MANTRLFRRDLEILLNQYSMENGSNTPDYILAEYLRASLAAFDLAVKERDRWWGHEPKVGGSVDGVL